MTTTVFVTGATAGFGLAIVRRFAAEGAKVIGTGRRSARLRALKDELGENFHPLAFDVGHRPEAEAAIAALPDEFKAVDILVNNAGGALGLDPAQSANLDDWDEMIASNISGLVYCTRLLLPSMIDRKSGHVINLGSIAGEFPYIQPGLSGGTEFSIVRFKGDESKAASVYAGTEPLMAEDVADAVHCVATRPNHVNINVVQMMPTCQAFGPLAVYRRPATKTS
jgi:3-hydroxy acid dehydrogenase/malonic semialdehyde reductase